MRYLLLIITGFSIALGPVAFAGVGRIGNSSIGSETEGFESVLPRQFPVTEEVFQRLIMKSNIRTSINQPLEIVAQTLANVFGDTRSWSRQRWFDEFNESASFQEWIDVNEHSCILATRLINNDGDIVAFAAFGGGRGVVFTGPSSRYVWDAVKSLLESIQLTHGDCQW